jgi:hypothetical protein
MFRRTCSGGINLDREQVCPSLASSIYGIGTRIRHLRRVSNFHKEVCGLRGPDNFGVGDTPAVGSVNIGVRLCIVRAQIHGISHEFLLDVLKAYGVYIHNTLKCS